MLIKKTEDGESNNDEMKNKQWCLVDGVMKCLGMILRFAESIPIVVVFAYALDIRPWHEN